MNRRALLLAIAGFALPLPGRAGEGPVLRGRVVPLAGKPTQADTSLVLVTLDGVKHTLEGDEFSMAQLRDSRLAGRLWELEGKPEPDGAFQIHKLFTIKDDKRHVVKYYCEVCHIFTHSPGRCMCCQDDTELQEHPVD